MALASLHAARAAASADGVPPDPDPLIVPVAGASLARLHSDFDEWRGNHRHHALDILAPRGTPVLAAVDGSVRKLLTSRDGGLTIYETDASEAMVYYYAHLDRYATDLKEGLTLRRGDVIGYVGTTGNAPPGAPHLHFAVARLPASKKWWKGTAIDPYPLLRDCGVTVPIDRLATGGR